MHNFKLYYQLTNSHLIVVALLILISSFLNQSCRSDKNYPIGNNSLPGFIDSITIVDTKFIIAEDSSIIFSANKSEYFKLYRYKNGKVTPQLPHLNNLFNPFFFQGNLGAIQDFNGNELFIPTLKELNEYTNGNILKFLKSSASGNYLVLQHQNDSGLYFINPSSKDKTKLITVRYKLNSIIFSEDEKFLIISSDDNLYYYEIQRNKLIEIYKDLIGEKLNSSIHKNNIFFVNNSNSEYYEIYKGNLNNLDSNPLVVYKTNYDLRLPKFEGKYLYYLQIINSEYLLFRKELNRNEPEQITERGVVYDFDFYLDNKLVFIYSDFNTPASLILYDLSNNSFNNLTVNSIFLEADYHFLKPNSSLSPAYILNPTNSKKPKGIILYIHPGLKSDYSPRWDTIIMTLLSKGFIIIAPNYPMSGGYGKTYNNLTLDSALQDLLNWKKYLKQKFNNLPLYLLSASSGNILLEQFLNKDRNDIAAAASLFGLQSIAKTHFSTPILYVLGENDPIVNFSSRNFFLIEAKKNGSDISIISYKDEGHWFRKLLNTKDVLIKVLDHFNQNK